MQIRIASQADIPQMHEVRMSVRENQLSDPSRIGLEHYRSMLAERGQGWVAEIGDRIVGFGVADYSSSNIWALFVHPDFEGRGIGRRLHDAMMQWCFEKGAARVWLTTSPATRAERFYKSAGWRMAGREANGESRFEISREAWSTRSTGA
ncbi:MAG TPA: GNAT family N-acetyltransferase [Pyrinomonadaceae bacterium]|nr:GNAT family N-acetyltransferase [Pyrinomonadaceae bacterium]